MELEILIKILQGGYLKTTSPHSESPEPSLIPLSAITYLWFASNEGMDPSSSPYITPYSSFHFLTLNPKPSTLSTYMDPLGFTAQPESMNLSPGRAVQPRQSTFHPQDFSSLGCCEATVKGLGLRDQGYSVYIYIYEGFIAI